MIPINQQFAKEAQNALEWLILSGVTTELKEEAGLGWKREEDHAAGLSSSILNKEPAVDTVKEEKPENNANLAKFGVQIPRFETIAALNQFCASWKESGLAKTASRAVLGTGAVKPKLMVISDMPDDDEDRSGIAFNSPSNRLVQSALAYAGYNPEQCYFSYLSKWRTPSRRNLNAHETGFCRDLLLNEIGLVAPEAILSLGAATYAALFTDSLGAKTKLPVKNSLTNHQLNTITPLLASQKGEFLVKNPLMKKSFWFSLIQFAADTRSGDSSPQGTPVNNAESTATFQ